jgi:Papain-like cysteine protease AvrRpt2
MPFKFNTTPVNEFPIEKQQMSNWCWAACTISIRGFYNKNQTLSQKQLVARVLQMPVCTSPRPLPPCNKTFDFGEALNNAGHLSGHAVEKPLSQNDLAVALQAGRPIGCQMEIPQIGGHAVIIISGKPDNSGALFLKVADPSDGSILSMSFSMLRNNFRGIGGRWVRSYFTKPLHQV